VVKNTDTSVPHVLCINLSIPLNYVLQEARTRVEPFFFDVYLEGH
jgi:hypothetical protein